MLLLPYLWVCLSNCQHLQNMSRLHNLVKFDQVSHESIYTRICVLFYSKGVFVLAVRHNVTDVSVSCFLGAKPNEGK